MTKFILLAGAAAALTLSGVGMAGAQVIETSQVGAVTGTTRITDRIEDIEEEALEEFERSQDQARFGSAAVPPGFRGGIFASGAATSGNTETIDFGLGARFTLGQGRFNHTFGVAAEYGESDEDRNENRVLGIYDLNYDITDRFYAFGIARAQYDEFDFFNEDYFIGAGPGYRVLNTPELAWRLQVGPGYRYTEDQDDNGESEIAGILSSRFFYQFSEQLFMTNDTDLLYSETNTAVTNDLGVNVALQGPLSLRVGLLTDYNSDPALGFDEFDHSINAAVVYSIN